MKKSSDDNYYIISDIYKALRGYLLEEYKVLSEMLSLIKIDSNVSYDARIKILQEEATNILGNFINYKTGLYKGKILLFISKSGFSPARMVRNYKTRYNEDNDPLYSVDNADFIIEKEEDNFVFKNRYNYDISNTYRPKLSIKDLDRFSQLYQKLEDNGYLTYPSIMYFNRNDPEYSFSISSQRISLQQNQSYNKDLIIEYDPKDDSFLVKDNRKKPNLTSKEMFNLPISKKNIYKGYANIIDNYLSYMNSQESEKGHEKVLKKG